MMNQDWAGGQGKLQDDAAMVIADLEPTNEA